MLNIPKDLYKVFVKIKSQKNLQKNLQNKYCSRSSFGSYVDRDQNNQIFDLKFCQF